MTLSRREVVNIWDKWTKPEKPKIHLCICPKRQLFLRINTKPIWTPNHFLSHVDNADIIEHDSYVELNRLFRNRAYEISRARSRGFMSDVECRALVATAYGVATLSDEEKEFIDRQIG